MYRIKCRVIATAVLLAFLLFGCAEEQVQPELIPSDNTAEQSANRYADACAAASQGDYLNSMLLFASLGDWEDARERYLENGYAYAEQLLEEGDLLSAISYFEFVHSYEDAEARILDTKSSYIQKNPDLSDVITRRLLCEEEPLQRLEIRAIHRHLCSRKAEILSVSTACYDDSSSDIPLSQKDCIYVKLRLQSSLPKDTTDLLLKLNGPDGITFFRNYSDISGEYGIVTLPIEIDDLENKPDETWQIMIYDDYFNLIGSTTFRLTD